jgi:hypothetical protein
MLHIAQHTLHGQRDLHFGRRQYPQRGLRARLHFGGSFLCLQGTWMFASRRKEPPPSAHAFNRLRDIADSHSGGVWKMFDRSGNRIGTFDQNLVKIAK